MTARLHGKSGVGGPDFEKLVSELSDENDRPSDDEPEILRLSTQRGNQYTVPDNLTMSGIASGMKKSWIFGDVFLNRRMKSSERIVLDINVSAPAFRLRDIFGRTIDLDSCKGRKVLICFFRHAGCPFCNLRVHALQKRFSEWKERGLEMIFFFESSERVLMSSMFHKEVSPIPLIADPEKIWYQAYGIENSAFKSAVSHLTGFIQTAIKARLEGVPIHLMAGDESINTMPAEFLLDEMSVIRKVHYAKGLNDRMSIAHIDDFLLRKPDAPIPSSRPMYKDSGSV